MNRVFYSFNAYKNNLDQRYEPLRKNMTYIVDKLFLSFGCELVGLNKIDINSWHLKS